MNIEYCNNCCETGKAARDRFLRENNSAFDAAFDFRIFTKKCFETCSFKEKHFENVVNQEKK